MMRKCVVLALMLILNVVLVYSQTADDIIQKALQAQGNENLRKFQSMKLSGKISSMGSEIPFKLFYKSPKSIRSEMTIDKKTIIQAFDGKEGWYINPEKSNSPEKMPDEMLQQLRSQTNMLESPFTDYKKKGIKLKLVAKKKVDGKDAFQIKLTQKDGKSMYVFIEAGKYIFFKTLIDTKVQGKKMKVETTMKNHKNISGVLIPHYVENIVNGKVASTMILDKVEANVKIDDSIFKMPK